MARGWGLGSRLLAAIVAVVLVAAGTAWVVASAIGPTLFHDHLVPEPTSQQGVVEHAEQAFSTASAITLALALLAALLTSVLVSIFLTRRISRSLVGVRQAADRIANEDYTARVPVVGMGAEFDDLARAFNTMAEDLGQIEQTRTQMLGDLAHEMRTPLATLDAYMEAILDGVTQPDEATLMMMRQQVGRLIRLAEDISLVTSAEEGRLTTHRAPVSTAQIIDTAVAQATRRYEEKGVNLEVDADALARETVLMADAERVGQVMTNLLDNALRHTPHGGTVWFRAERDHQTVRVRVRDDGEGIAAQHLPHLFERFYRADTARDRAHGGSGVGLAIVRSITRAHGGTVSAQSAGLGTGAEFTVELPVPDDPPFHGRPHPPRLRSNQSS